MKTEKVLIDSILQLFSIGQYNNALTEAKYATQKFGQSPVLWNILGACRANLKQMDEAIKCYKKAIQIDSQYGAAHNNLGNAFKHLGKPTEAKISYEKAIQVNPNLSEPYFNLGVISQDNFDMDNALDLYERALSLKPDYVEALNNLGNIHREEGRLEQSISVFKKALDLEPNSAVANNNLGLVYRDQGQIKEAIDFFNKATSLRPDYAEAYSNLGNCEKKRGKVKEAVINYEKALKLDPQNGLARHFCAALKGENTKTAPRDYVEGLFDKFAVNFEGSLLKELDYKIADFSDIVMRNRTSKSLGSVLDLGCGTGLLGAHLRKFTDTLVGVDLSKSMLRIAENKKIYNKLIHGDLIDYLSLEELDFDYFVAADVFIYVGDLYDVFRLIKERNKKNGTFAFSTEYTDKERFILEQSGRYSHSKTYIEDLGEEFGFHLSHFSKSELRKQEGNFLTGGNYIFEF